MVMRHMASMNFAGNITPDTILEEALICCECGICETYACPMGLSPRQVNKYVKKQLAGVRFKKPETPLEPSPMRAYRKIAPPKIMARMGLLSLYDNKVKDFGEFTPDLVKISVKQHIGAPARPVVQAGDTVTRGQLIASADGKVSANIHASIDGAVLEVGSMIVIRRH